MAVRSSPARQRPKHREGEITGSGGQTPTPGAGPVAGAMDPVRPQIREQLIRDCASLDWSTDPHQTPSGGSRALTPDRSEIPATGLCSKGIDTRGPVTEARNSHTGEGRSVARWANRHWFGEDVRADVCGEYWVVAEQHRQSGSVVGVYVDCAMSGPC